jgi:hypothetical protein
MDQMIAVCRTLATCPYYQKLGPGGVLAIWLTAREMGLPPMMCLNGGMYTFSGAVSLSSQLMNMMIINAGHEVDIIECSDTACEIRITRGDRKHKKDYKPFTYRYTIEHARIAGLVNKNNWKTNPRDMLFNRCLSGASRKHTPEATMGAYAIGELDGDGEIIDATPAAPEHPIKQTESPKEQPKPEEPKPIEFVKPEGWEAFTFKHGLLIDEKGAAASDKMEYVIATAEKTKMPIDKVIAAAITNEEIFCTRFEKWNTDRKPKEA